MKRPRPHTVAPPFPGRVVYGEILEAISEEEKAGRPRAPLVELLSPRAPDDRAPEVPVGEPPTASTHTE